MLGGGGRGEETCWKVVLSENIVCTQRAVALNYSLKTHIGLVPRPCGRREKWPGIHCLRMCENPHDFMGYCIPSFTNRLSLPYSSKACPSRAYPTNVTGKSEDFDKALKFALCCIGKGDFMLKAEQLDAIKCIYDGKDGIC